VKNIVRNAIVDSSATKVIPYVLNWRKILTQGFIKNEKPSRNELPNNLYSASVIISL